MQSMNDMLRDNNCAGVSTPDGLLGGPFGVNVVGSGADASRPPVPEASSALRVWLGLAVFEGRMAWHGRVASGTARR